MGVGARRPRSVGQCGGEDLAVHRGTEVPLNNGGRVGDFRLGQHQDRHHDSRLTQAPPFFHQGDRKPLCAAGQSRFGGRHVAVAVSIGLDHCAHQRRSDFSSNRSNVGGYGVEIHLDPRRPHRNNLLRTVVIAVTLAGS